MNDTSFYSRLPEDVRKPTDKELKLICFVYLYHPCIDCDKGMEQLAQLYSTFGMRIIRDMEETAKRCEEIQSERRPLEQRIKELDTEYEALKDGRA